MIKQFSKINYDNKKFVYITKAQIYKYKSQNTNLLGVARRSKEVNSLVKMFLRTFNQLFQTLIESLNNYSTTPTKPRKLDSKLVN